MIQRTDEQIVQDTLNELDDPEYSLAYLVKGPGKNVMTVVVKPPAPSLKRQVATFSGWKVPRSHGVEAPQSNRAATYQHAGFIADTLNETYEGQVMTPYHHEAIAKALKAGGHGDFHVRSSTELTPEDLLPFYAGMDVHQG